jgi:RecB family exonuclease
MPVSLIVGPLNSGRAGAVLSRFRALRDADPLLVVPNRDDAERFERELAQAGEATMGGSVVTFPRLLDEVARAGGVEHGSPLTPLQRTWLARCAARRTELRALRASALREGFAPALERLVSELRSARVDPATLEAAAGELDGGAYEAEVARLYGACDHLRAELGRDDDQAIAERAISALGRDPGAWGRRPVLLYGFDELSEQQLELLRVLSPGAEVWVAVAYEDRAALTARAGLLSRLREELGAEVRVELGPERAHTRSEALYHLERSLFEPDAERRAPDDGIRFLAAGGERAEAELIGGEVSRLLAAGAPADEIAVVVREPGRRGALVGRVLSSLGIPVAVEARLPLARTGTGTALLALVRAALPGGTAGELIRYLRLGGGPRPHQVDWLERAARRRRMRSAEEAVADWESAERGYPLEEVARVREAAARGGASLLAAVAGEAERISQRRHRRRAPRPGAAELLELRAGAAAAGGMAELSELHGLEPEGPEVLEALALVTVPQWRGTVEGRVRILGPGQVGASRPRHLFCASLQDGEFPGPGASEPLLGSERRAGLGIPRRPEPADEERYLFYVCASRPTERLHLGYHLGDEDGRALSRSAFVDEVRDLLDPAPPAAGEDELERGITLSRPLAQVAFPPSAAPTETELARSLAALRPPAARAEALDGLRVPEDVAGRVLARLASAQPPAPPGPLAHPDVLAELRAGRLYGATSLEQFHTCSYIWFVRHELDPQGIDPDPDPIAQGGIAHAVLQRLYAEPPAGGPVPSAGSLRGWRDRAWDLLDAELASRGLEPGSATSRLWRRRLGALLDRFLRREAELASPMRPDPELLEARFGEDADDDREPVDLGGWLLHGRIDRVDVSAEGHALVRDYKVSAGVPTAKRMVGEGRVQVHLYMLALRAAWGLEPIGGLYHPLAATRDDRPRGPMARSERGTLIPGEGLVATDFLEEEAFEEALEEARVEASGIVGRMRAGDVRRDPREGRCPDWCTLQSVCRIERAVPPEDLDDAEGEP